MLVDLGGGCSDFSGMDILSGGVVGGEGLAIVGIMPFLPASQAESLSETPASLGRGEFGDGDGIDIHGVGIFLWSGSKREG